MSEPVDPKLQRQKVKEEREARLRENLRANLRRRKSQAKARKTPVEMPKNSSKPD